MTDQLYTLVLVSAAVTVLICLAIMWHADHDAELGRDLREAAGSEEDALFAIDQARTDRKYLGKRIEPKVLHFPPQLRIVRGGEPVQFPPDGAA